MDREEKIKEIINFIATFPESTASRAIIRRYYLNSQHFESSKELSLELRDVLQKERDDEINFCFYLVK